MARWKLTFPAQLPTDPAAQWGCGIHGQKLDILIKASDTVWLARIALIPPVLAEPRRIIRGWGRDKTDCWVYVGFPDCDYRSASIQTPPPTGMLFLVFVLNDGTIDHWTWRPICNDDPEMPEGMEGETVWPPTI
jgi:hypothetical protein